MVDLVIDEASENYKGLLIQYCQERGVAATDVHRDTARSGGCTSLAGDRVLRRPRL